MLRTFCGSPAYTAPEIIKKQTYAAEAIDVWCLGGLLYIMLAAEFPFGADIDNEMKANISRCTYKKIDGLSHEALELFDIIFKPAEERIKLKNLKNTQFFQKYYDENTKPNFINV